MSQIIQNGVTCLKCGDRVYSAYTHDFQKCGCGAVAVDGGMSYLRRVGNTEDYKDISIALPDEVYNGCMDALKWADDNRRNNLGRLCALFRALRGAGYKIVETDDYKVDIKTQEAER